MKKHLFLIFNFLVFSSVYSQVTFVLDELPVNTPDSASVYISGDFEGWTGGQEKYKFSNKNNTFFITLPKQIGSINYKFTLSSWESVETNTQGRSIDNRSYIPKKENDTVRIKILGWSDQFSIKSTATKNVSILSENFYIPQSDRKRRIWIYVPPDYASTSKNYPVIYMHDGQNLFDESTSFSGEWEVDEILNKIYTDKKLGFIVVGIENGGSKRMDEYSPWKNTKYGGGEGDAYVEFIVQTLKPYVDENYRTYPHRNNTAIMGSSMGGLISYYAALKYPNVFSKSGVFSPSFWFSEKSFDYAKENGNLKNSKMYFLAGNKEGDNVAFEEISNTVKGVNKVSDLLKEAGFNANYISTKIVAEGKHNEKFWRENFEEAVLWLFDE